MTDTALADELERLDAQATPGPWTVSKSGLDFPAWVCYPESDHAKHPGICSLTEATDTRDPDREVRFYRGEADERLIAFLRSHVSEILTALRR